MLLLIFEDYWNEEYHMCHIEEFMCINQGFYNTGTSNIPTFKIPVWLELCLGCNDKFK